MLTTASKNGFGIVVLFVIALNPALVRFDLGTQGSNVAGHQLIQSGFGRQPADRVITS